MTDTSMCETINAEIEHLLRERDEMQNKIYGLNARIDILVKKKRKLCRHHWNIDRTMWGETSWFCPNCGAHSSQLPPRDPSALYMGVREHCQSKN